MVISPCVPWYVPILGSFVAVAIAKHCFGGLGCNIWNPALVGRAFVLSAFVFSLTSVWHYPLTTVQPVTRNGYEVRVGEPRGGDDYSGEEVDTDAIESDTEATDADPDAITDAEPDANAHTYTNSQANTHSHAHTDAHPHSRAHSGAHARTHSHT